MDTPEHEKRPEESKNLAEQIHALQQEVAKLTQPEPAKAESFLNIPSALVVAAVIIGGVLLYQGGVQDQGVALVAKTSDPEAYAMRQPDASDHILGSADAPVKVIEYSDLECPFCKRFHGTMIQIVNEYSGDGRVAWVYRHFPLEQIHASARSAAVASECAAELGGKEQFWQFVDEIFTSPDPLDAQLINSTALALGLPSESFGACLESGAIHERVDRDIQDGRVAGVQGTPHTVVVAKNGRQFVINGAQPYETVKAAIEQALQEK